MTWHRSPPSSRASPPCPAGADKDRFEHSREHTDRAPADHRRGRQHEGDPLGCHHRRVDRLPAVGGDPAAARRADHGRPELAAEWSAEKRYGAADFVDAGRLPRRSAVRGGAGHAADRRGGAGHRTAKRQGRQPRRAVRRRHQAAGGRHRPQRGDPVGAARAGGVGRSVNTSTSPRRWPGRTPPSSGSRTRAAPSCAAATPIPTCARRSSGCSPI